MAKLSNRRYSKAKWVPLEDRYIEHGIDYKKCKLCGFTSMKSSNTGTAGAQARWIVVKHIREKHLERRKTKRQIP